jgi:hypothetical protein
MLEEGAVGTPRSIMRKIRTTGVDEKTLGTAQPRLAVGLVASIFDLITRFFGLKRRVNKVTMLSSWLKNDIGSL